jgi:acyl-coenzyme A thioesterase PaaI-like protein
MSKRSGPFCDAVDGRAPMPRAAATLGLEFIDADVESGTIELAFSATEDFTNPAGNVLGAFVAAMLYDTVGPALLATLEPDQFQSTLELNVNFLRSIRPEGSSARVVSSTETVTSPLSRRRCSIPRAHSSPPPPLSPGSSPSISTIRGMTR